MSTFVRFVAGVVLVLALVACAAATTTVAEVQGVSIVGGDQTLVVGASVALSAVVQTTGGASTAVVWSSDAPDVVSVDSVSGVAEAVAPGTATVSAVSSVDPSKVDAIGVTVDPPGVVRWTRQFGTVGFDFATGVAVDGAGRTSVVGYTSGALEGSRAGENDAFVRSYDADGGLRWTRQFGTSDFDSATGVAVDEAGVVAVVGKVSGALEGANAGGEDAYVRTYDADGVLRWTRQFGTSSGDRANGVVFDGDGRVYVAGYTLGGLVGINAGSFDAFVRSYDADGGLQWTRQFATGNADVALSVAVDADDRVYVAGYTGGGLEGSNAGALDAFVRSYDADGGLRWTRQFGTSSSDVANGLAVDGAGRVFVAGYTGGGLEGVNAGGEDGFVRSYDADGGLRWTRQFGTAGVDRANGLAVDGAGRVYVAGYTGGGLDGVNAGGGDAFVRSYDADGGLRWAQQFGTSSDDGLLGVDVDAGGRSYVAGFTDGAVAGSSAGVTDAFVRSYGP